MRVQHRQLLQGVARRRTHIDHHRIRLLALHRMQQCTHLCHIVEQRVAGARQRLAQFADRLSVSLTSKTRIGGSEACGRSPMVPCTMLWVRSIFSECV